MTNEANIGLKGKFRVHLTENYAYVLEDRFLPSLVQWEASLNMSHGQDSKIFENIETFELFWKW